MKRFATTILITLLAIAGGVFASDERVLREKFYSNGAMNGTNSSAQLSASYALGVTLYEVGVYGASASVTCTVARVSSDLLFTNTVTTVVLSSGEGLTTLYDVECPKSFAFCDILRVTANVTNVTFSAYGVIGVKEP